MLNDFWGLDAKLAEKRHYWSINWLKSYSLYHESLKDWFSKNIDKSWEEKVSKLMRVLREEEKLMEIVQLVGSDSLPPKQQLVLEVSKIIREELLQQNAFDEVDKYCTLKKANDLIDLVFYFEKLSNEALDKEVPINEVLKSKARFIINKLKLEKDYEKILNNSKSEIEKDLAEIVKKYK